MSGKKIRGFLIDVYNKKQATEIEFEDTLDNIYKLLDVETIDVVCLEVEGHRYDFVVDDEGLLREFAVSSVYDMGGKPVLVGNILIVNSDNEGNFTALPDEQIESLKRHIRETSFFTSGRIERQPVIVGVKHC